MPILPEERIADLITPYLDAAGDSHVPGSALAHSLSAYLDLLVRWNARTNLTAVREPEQIVRRHFGESLFAGSVLGRQLRGSATVLDFGTGAGFPGIPMQLLWPKQAICLAESQNKKVAFLREAVRVLGLTTELWAGRVEAMPPERMFDRITLRAVDDMNTATAIACQHLSESGILAILATDIPDIASNLLLIERFAMPESRTRSMYLLRKAV